MAEQKQNQLAAFDKQLMEVKNVKDLFTLPDVKDRFIKNFKALTGRDDGENRLEQERIAYMEIIYDKPELKAAPMWAHFSAISKAGYTGLSFREGKLYVQPVKDRDGNVVNLKVSSSPAGKREQFELMATVKSAPEAQVVLKGDIFLYDKLNQKIIKHETTEKTATSITLENILYSYQRIIWKDGTVTDIVVPHDDLIKAKSKSKIKSTDAGLWVDWPAEASKKTATNRAFRLYHKYPSNVVVVGGDDEEATDVPHTEVSYPEPPAESFEPNTGKEQVDYDTGEVHDAQVVTEEKKPRKTKNLLDED